MFKRTAADARWSVLICLFVLALITAVIVVPQQFGTQAAGNGDGLALQASAEEGETPRATGEQSVDALGDNGLPNYDIRLQSGEQTTPFFEGARQLAGRNAAGVADIRDGFVRGEETLRQTVP